MGLKDIIASIKNKIPKLKKKEKKLDEGPPEEEENLLEDPLETEKYEELEQTVKDLMETTEGLLAKVNDIESKLPKLESSINNLRKENEMLRVELNKINENLQDIMALYEVVSNQINPFIGVSKITATSLEKLERLETEYKRLKKTVEELTNDLIILGSLYLHQLDINLDEIIEEVLEEEIIKSMSGEDTHDTKDNK